MLHCDDQVTTDDYTLFNGDCVEIVTQLPAESVDFGIHSPPFSNLYIYSDSERDMGNCGSNEEFIEHYGFLIRELHRTTVTGRLCAVHCKDLPRYANRDGTAGLIDFPGMIIAAFEAEGWSYHSRVTIWKCPVTERERTNNNGLLHKTVLRDRSQIRQGMADYLLVFRKPPVGTLMSPKPVILDGPFEHEGGFHFYMGEQDPRESNEHPSKYARKCKGSMPPSVRIWQRYAEPVWWDINQTDVLNYKSARSDKDERHICPLQMGLIERAIHLWTEPGDVVLSPFAGVGSEGVGAIRLGRRFVGVELKPEYYTVALSNLRQAEAANKQQRLF